MDVVRHPAVLAGALREQASDGVDGGTIIARLVQRRLAPGVQGEQAGRRRVGLDLGQAQCDRAQAPRSDRQAIVAREMRSIPTVLSPAPITWRASRDDAERELALAGVGNAWHLVIIGIEDAAAIAPQVFGDTMIQPRKKSAAWSPSGPRRRRCGTSAASPSRCSPASPIRSA